MKDKLLQMRADDEFMSKVEYLRNINGHKSTSETIRCIIEKEWRKESNQNVVRCKNCIHWNRISITKDGNCQDHMIERRTKEDDYCSHGIECNYMK